MKLTRKQFIKSSAATAGGLLLSRQQALEHPAISAADKEIIRRDGRLSEPGYDMAPRYLLWEGVAVYAVDSWTFTSPGGRLTLGAVPLQ